MAKCFYQKFWIAVFTWDLFLEGDFLQEWTSVVSILIQVDRIAMPRCFLLDEECRLSLHGFCDVSEGGYAAVVYLITVSVSGWTASSFSYSKVQGSSYAISVDYIET